MYFHFLLDQKVKQKIKSHRPDASGRSGEISLGHHAESFASLVTTSAFRMLFSNRNFSYPHFRDAMELHIPPCIVTHLPSCSNAVRVPMLREEGCLGSAETGWSVESENEKQSE